MVALAKNHRKGTALHPKGQRRLEKILKEAKAIFIHEGYSALTMRNVAKKANTTVGNLQYYYPNKASLVADMLRYFSAEFYTEMENIDHDPRRSNEEKLTAFIERYLDDLYCNEMSLYCPELWALANHDDAVSKYLYEVFSEIRDYLKKLVKNVNPDLTSTQVNDMTILMMASMEGLLVFVGHGKPWASSVDRVRTLALQSYIDLVKQGSGKK